MALSVGDSNANTTGQWNRDQYVNNYLYTWARLFKTNDVVNILLNFETLISQICQYFLLKNVRSFCSAKASLIFSTKNISVFGYKVVKHELTS